MRFWILTIGLTCSISQAQVSRSKRHFEIRSSERRIELVGFNRDWTYRRIEKNNIGSATKLALPPQLMQRQYSLLRAEVFRWAQLAPPSAKCDVAKSYVQIEDLTKLRVELCPSRIQETAILSRIERLALWVEDGPPAFAR
jgi:hypothetical protein